ncbi:MAG: FtsQ-type POTRA domain-containing protein [Firmicutes bacterium]|nr:FtsQ-type POTRA domain-containing protein [Bacillota bacterium]
MSEREEGRPQEFPKNKRRKKKRKKKHYLLKFILLVALATGLYFLLTSHLFDIQNITVVDNSYFTSEQVVSLSQIKIGENLFETRLNDAKQRLLQEPYIKNATLRRKLPGTVEITLEERTEYAAVAYGMESIIIDSEGMVLRVASERPALPLLAGLETLEMTEGQPLVVKQNYSLTDTLKLIAVTEEAGLHFKLIRISPVTLKAYIYDNLYCEGTPENLINGMDNIKQVVFDLYDKGIERGVIKVGSDNYYSFSPDIEQ